MLSQQLYKGTLNKQMKLPEMWKGSLHERQQEHTTVHLVANRAHISFCHSCYVLPKFPTWCFTLPSFGTGDWTHARHIHICRAYALHLINCLTIFVVFFFIEIGSIQFYCIADLTQLKRHCTPPRGGSKHSNWCHQMNAKKELISPITAPIKHRSNRKSTRTDSTLPQDGYF